jgi:hypothetical protein
MKSSFIDSSLAPEFILIEPNSNLICTFTSVSPVKRILGLEEDVCMAVPIIFSQLRKYEVVQRMTKSDSLNCFSYVNSVFHWKNLGEKSLTEAELAAEYEKLKQGLLKEFRNSAIFRDTSLPTDTTHRCYNATKKGTKLISSPKAMINSDGSFSLKSGLIVESSSNAFWYLLIRSGIPTSQISNLNMFEFAGEAFNVYPIYISSICNCKVNEYISTAGLCVSCPNGCAECTNDNKCLKCINGREPINSKCSCLINQFMEPLDGSCKACSSKCRSCSGPEENECILCPDGRTSQGGLCSCGAGKILSKGECIGTKILFFKFS